MFLNIKKISILLLLTAVFSCSFTQASEPERVEYLTSSATFTNGEGYFVLSDESCWKVIGFSTRWRTLGEWWNGAELVPKNFENVPCDWAVGSSVEVYSKYENLSVNEADASNQDKLRQCTHLIFSQGTGMVLFAIPLSTANCVVQVFNDAHIAGYDKGYLKGYKEGCNNNYDTTYSLGFADGYNKGHQDGLESR